MNESMTHERCSELLAPYRAGKLSTEERLEVDAHLSACAACRTELAGLTALEDGEPTLLMEAERARLHERVASALRQDTARPTDVLPMEPRFRPPLGARWLGAVAALLLIVVAAGAAGGLFGNGAGEADTGAEGAGGGAATLESGPELDGPEPVLASSAEELVLSVADEAGNDEKATQAAASEALRATGDLNKQRLTRLARSSPLLPAFAEAYGPADAAGLGPEFLRLLAEQASPGIGSQIRDCGGEALDESLSPILPVFAAPVSYESQRALLLVFVTGESVFDSYAVLVSARGSCVPLDYFSGRLRG
jgi:putative zinc finger protein